ncbi:hypothetical protein SAMN05444159_1700 [Bradyrhizobium lablabi]|uniref:Uncharacterized protein n=1 Tax=Bradyrhizobium lablabi TaxID=722472 RepID=A0A1M6MQC4_9BRAD|nr:hypothetical protein [Bradyrhizobium lablabi]SHJ85667.1 hypothetical protein SAMN05444159_1700 [Bradyrhizobium lablabi]
MYFRLFLAGLSLVFVINGPVPAHSQGSAQPGTLSTAAINSFLANPGQLLNSFPNGGQGLAQRTREYLAADKAALEPLIKLLQSANKDQQDAMASGLAQAAKAYSGSDQQFSNEIQTAVARTGIEEVIKAYASVAGDTGTASTGGGGGAGGGSGGATGSGLPSGGTNGGTFPTAAAFPNAFNLLTGATSLSSLGASVSPH